MAKDKEPVNHAETSQEAGEISAALAHSTTQKAQTIDVIVLALYLAGAAYVFSILISLHPNAGSWYSLFYVYLFPGILSRLFKVINRTFIKKHERGYRWLISLLAVAVGLLLIRTVTSIASDIAMDRFELAFRPLVDALHENKITICNRPEDEVDNPDSIRPQTQVRGTVWIHFSESRFVISTRGGSIDIDGSTIYYYSKEKEWRLFHNDHQAKMDSFNLLVEDFRRCKFS